jgi:hypothetical protein
VVRGKPSFELSLRLDKAQEIYRAGWADDWTGIPDLI